MRLLVNHQLIPLPIRPKSISLELSRYERSQAIVGTFVSLHYLLFSTPKNKKDLKRISVNATNVVLH